MSCPVLALGLAGAVVGLAAAEAVPPLTRAKPAPPIPNDPRTTPAPMAVFFTLEPHLFFMSISPVSGRVPNWASVWGLLGPAGPTGLSSSKPPAGQGSVLEM